MVQCGARNIFTDPLVHALGLSKKNKKTKKREECRGHSLHIGAPSLESKVGHMHCSVPVSLGSCLCWFSVVFRNSAGFRLYYSIQITTAIPT